MKISFFSKKISLPKKELCNKGSDPFVELKTLTECHLELQYDVMSTRFDRAKTILESHRQQLSGLGTRHLAIFGSTARNEATKESDIDILVDFDPKKGLFIFVELKIYLSDILNCEVDLVSTRALHPALKKRILNEAKQIF